MSFQHSVALLRLTKASKRVEKSKTVTRAIPALSEVLSHPFGPSGVALVVHSQEKHSKLLVLASARGPVRVVSI